MQYNNKHPILLYFWSRRSDSHIRIDKGQRHEHLANLVMFIKLMLESCSFNPKVSTERSINLKNISSWNSIAQKMNEILDKILPYEARAEFCSSITFIFWAMEFQEKNTFEIYWPLIVISSGLDLFAWEISLIQKLEIKLTKTIKLYHF